ncbi:uncharacterized protein [Palaemon carinicauda]|uniref:uncharacterized protein n=1 Tax=Palaemon carinicauda TaxID=392227 RepID=UPI0035B656E5
METLIKVKRLDPPEFSGDMRNYGTFKRDYMRLIVPFHGQDAYALKKCLSGEALTCVEGVEDEFEEMFRRLDDKYGNPCKLTEAIVSELKSLKPLNDGDSKRLVYMIKAVERAWLDMRKIGLESEMKTTSIVTLVERLLPPTLKRNWVIKSQKVGNAKDLFENLLQFLLQERRVCEYLESDLRCSTSSKVVTNSASCDNTSENVKDDLDEMKLIQGQHSAMISECLTTVSRLAAQMSNNPDVKCPPKWCWYHGVDGHSIYDCYAFKSLSNYDKFAQLKRNNTCYKCVNLGHFSKFCNVSGVSSCDVMVNGKKCGREHHKMLHSLLYKPTTFTDVTSNLVSRDGHLLMVSGLRYHQNDINVLWDSGSNVSLITHQKAQELGLNGRDVQITITKVGNKTETVSSKEYTVPVVDIYGVKWEIIACGIDEITTPVEKVDMNVVSCLFKSLNGLHISRPFGVIHLLIGIDYCVLMPQVIETNGNLQLMLNQFGYVVRGFHPQLTSRCYQSNVSVRINHIDITDVNEITSVPRKTIKDVLDNYLSIESLGTSCYPKCSGCKCGNCTPGQSNCTLKEERELAQISHGLSFNSDKNRWSVAYPWVRNPNLLPNNVSLATARLIATEKRLTKLGLGYCTSYQNQIHDMISRGVARKLSEDEIYSYKGPIFYIPHTEVLKPDSSSTPLRIVFNSSARYMNFSLNEMWAKGPDMLNSLLGVLLRFRENEVAFVCDLAKMYNTISLSLFDQHCHRFLWRDFKVDVKPDHYMLTCVPFGDKPSGTIAMLALKLTAEMSKDEYPVATQIIVNNSYVDDILGSCDSIEIANELMKQIERIIGRGGFKIKHWILSGNENHENPNVKVTKREKEKVLGIVWDPHRDRLVYEVKINFSPKHRKIHTEPNLAPDDLMVNVPQYLTRRMLLSQIASQYDPLGLVCPVTLRAKLMMRQLISRTEGIEGKVSHYDWDSAVSTDIRNEWLSYFQMLFELQSLSFPRCVKVEGTIGKPMLVIFSDGSSSAYGACAYVRWELSDGGFCSRLLMAKSRLAPLKQLSIPRIELCGALVAARMRETIVKEMNFEFESVMHIVDSAIVRAQIQKESYGFGTFTATKIAEIQSKTDVGEWSWVSGDNNPADLTTKPAKPIDLGQESMWQMGPAFLTLPISKWPIRKDHIGDLPDRVGVFVSHTCFTVNTVEMSLVFQISRFESSEKLLRVTSRVLKAFKFKSFKGIFQTPNIDEISQAEMLWVREIQSTLGKDWEFRYRRLGPSVNKDGLIVVGQRIPRWLKNNYDQDGFVLLSPDHEFVKLYVKTMHRQFHSGVENTLAKIQSKFWVPRVRNMIKSVKFKCVTCRKLTKEIAGQVMGQLPLERLKPSPPFAYTALDLYGPFFIRDTVKGRTKGKAYGVIFNCLSTRAVHLDLIEGYSAKDFLDGLRRFVSLRGCPKEIYSDRGTQLTAAEKELRNATEIFKIKWIFNASADAPWQNGVSESLIKSVKRSLTIAIGDNILTFSKLQTTLYEIANLLNERPIGIKPGCDPELGRYLCPNDLLLGRTQNAVLKGEFERFPSHESRLKFHEGITDTFWRKWMRDFFPTMLIRQKWHVEKRNLQVGDLVLFQDSNVVRGNWKLAEVLLADKGKDKKVRNVTLRYKPIKSGITYKGERDVIVKRSAHRIVVILPIEERLDLP